jgi:tetratricopeptide (TPR) repeat protein
MHAAQAVASPDGPRLTATPHPETAVKRASRRAFAAISAMAVIVAIGGGASAAAAQAAPAQTAAAPAKKKPAAAAAAATPGKPAALSPAKAAEFRTLSTQAETARQAGRLDDAVALYRQALAIKPGWPEGMWALGTSLYELEHFEDAREAFRRYIATNDKDGTAWALKGLCEYRVRNYDTALSDLLQARARGVAGGQQVAEVARYHTAVLSTRIERYEQALSILSDFALESNEAPRVIEAMGIATLRLPLLPEELPGEKREIVMMAGRARYFMAARMGTAAQNAFAELINRFPETAYVHYSYGVYLLAEQPDAAIEEFKRELKVAPQNMWAKVQIAFALIRRGDFEAAKPWAQESVAAAPTEFVARNALGQVLLETGDLDGAIREFETGVKLASDSPAMHFALARAYRRAKRTADADREQAEFTRLDRMARAARTGAASIGGIDTAPAPPPDPKRQP